MLAMTVMFRPLPVVKRLLISVGNSVSDFLIKYLMLELPTVGCCLQQRLQTFPLNRRLIASASRKQQMHEHLRRCWKHSPIKAKVVANAMTVMKVRASTLCVRRAIKALKSQKHKRQTCIEVFFTLTRVMTSMEVIATLFLHADATAMCVRLACLIKTQPRRMQAAELKCIFTQSFGSCHQQMRSPPPCV